MELIADTHVRKIPVFSESKRRLLEKYLREGTAQSFRGASAIGPRPDGEPAPLSLSQEQVLLREALVPRIPALYNESVTIHRFGRLDLDALERSLTEVIRRHEIWRTTYVDSSSGKFQVVRPAPEHMRLPLLDQRALPADRRAADTAHLLSGDARNKLDMERGPLVSAHLARFDEEEFRLYLIVHQSVLDGVSVYQVLLTELAALYNAYSQSKPSPLSELPVQFGDYAYWQRNQLGGEALARQMEYWREQLCGELPVLRWPTRRPRPSQQSFRGAIEPFAFSKSLTESLKALAQRAGSTLFVSLLSAFGVLLHAYTRQSELMIGTVSPAGRKRSEVQKLMGYFLNPVPLRFRLDSVSTFLDLFIHVQNVLGGAISHDDIPFEHLVKELRLNTDASRNPCFTVAASLEPPLANVGPEWNLTPMDVNSGGARWDLYFVWDDRPSGMIGRVQYNPDLFEPEEVTSMIADFRYMLQTMIEDPTQKIRNLNLDRFAGYTDSF